MEGERKGRWDSERRSGEGREGEREGGGGERERREITGYEPFKSEVDLEAEEGRYKATGKREFKLLWRKAGPLKSSR